MNSTDVIAYAIDADIVCADCATADEARDCSPSFCGAEADTPQHCARCGCLIDGYCLTPDGRQYVALRLAEREGDSEVLAQWAELLEEHGPDSFEKAAMRFYHWRCALAEALEHNGGEDLAEVSGPVGDALRLADENAREAWDAANGN